MGTAGDIDEDLLLESGDGSPEKAGCSTYFCRERSHIPPGERENRRLKSAFKRGYVGLQQNTPDV